MFSKIVLLKFHILFYYLYIEMQLISLYWSYIQKACWILLINSNNLQIILDISIWTIMSLVNVNSIASSFQMLILPFLKNWP